MSQARVSSDRNKPGVIDEPAFPEHGGGEGGSDMSGSAFEAAAAPRDDVHGYSDAAEPGIDIAVAKNGSGGVAGDNDAEIQVAVRS
jgi:hypothetical protein